MRRQQPGRAKLNCWEFMQCGREPRGANADALGVCPAAASRGARGINGGKNGGRACWALAGSFCPGGAQGSNASRLPDCMACEFFALVGREEGAGYMGAKSIRAQVGSGTRKPVRQVI